MQIKVTMELPLKESHRRTEHQLTLHSRFGPDGPRSARGIFEEDYSADNPAPPNRVAAGEPGG